MKLFIIRWWVDDNCSCCEHRYKGVNERWGPREKEDHFTSMWKRSSASVIVTFHSHWGAKSLHIASSSIFTEREGEENRVWCSWEWPWCYEAEWMKKSLHLVMLRSRWIREPSILCFQVQSPTYVLDYLLIFLSLIVSAFKMKVFQFFPGLGDWIKSMPSWNWGCS